MTSAQFWEEFMKIVNTLTCIVNISFSDVGTPAASSSPQFYASLSVLREGIGSLMMEKQYQKARWMLEIIQLDIVLTY